MESMISPPNHNHAVHAYLRSIPCDLLLGDYFISVDKFDDFVSDDDYCPSLVVQLNAGADADAELFTMPCPNASGCSSRHDYTCYVTNILTDWFSQLGFRPALIARLSLEIGCFVLTNAWRHRCPTRRCRRRPAVSVPYISISHVSLVMERLNEGAMPRVKRATDESISALEKVRCTDLDSDEDNRDGLCVVCLEKLDFKVQEEVVRMQCSHVFHQDCIVEWLKRSHVCPLCRFEMPAIDV